MKRIFNIFLLSLCFCATAVAQKLSEFTVVSFEEKPLDRAARDERYKIVDGNGDLFSIIKLVSNNAGDDLRAYSFDFGLCESRVKQVDGEVWVYVQRNAMRATIRRDGYKTVKYELNTTVQPGKVYEMVLTAEALPVYREILQFNIKPVGVKATVMYKSTVPGAQFEVLGVADENGSVAKRLELGTYIYEVHSENYHKSEGRIELKEDNGTHIENVVLRPKFSTVTFEAGEGVDIYINDDKVGAGSWSGVLNAGTYSVECRKAKHKSVRERVTVEENKELTKKLKAPTPIVGALSVISHPLEAHITINGKDYGITPKTIDNLLIGEYKVTISKAKYNTESMTVQIRERETTECDVQLSAISKVTAPSSSATVSSSKYNKKNCGYVEAVAQAGYMMAAGANVGCYISNFNIEAYGTFGLCKSRLRVITSYDNKVYELRACKFGGRLGYGIALGNRFRLTPQLGAGLLVAGGDGISAKAVTGSCALRTEFVIVKHLGISLTPEYTFAISKKKVFDAVSNVSKRINGWANGVNASMGIYFYF